MLKKLYTALMNTLQDQDKKKRDLIGRELYGASYVEFRYCTPMQKEQIEAEVKLREGALRLHKAMEADARFEKKPVVRSRFFKDSPSISGSRSSFNRL